MSCTTAMMMAAVLSFNTTTDLDVTRVKAKNKLTIAKKAAVGDITGYYTCNGEDANGKRYKGIATIVKKNDVYVVQWTVGIGSNFVGVGIRKGDTLAISWAMEGEKRFVRGVNLYRITSGPRLTGHWTTLPGDGFLQTETLTFLKRMD